jgi:hypothetical protein
MEGTLTAPDTFDLIVELDGSEAPCKVAWRRGAEVGVMFTAAPRLRTPKRKQVVTAIAPGIPPSLRRQGKS